MKVPVGISTVVAVLTILSTGIAAVVTSLEGAGVGVPLTLTVIAGVVASVLSVVRSWQANTLTWMGGAEQPEDEVVIAGFDD